MKTNKACPMYGRDWDALSLTGMGAGGGPLQTPHPIKITLNIQNKDTKAAKRAAVSDLSRIFQKIVAELSKIPNVR